MREMLQCPVIAVLVVFSGLLVLTKSQSMGDDRSKITWAHAVNSQAELKEALDSDVQMLEADISLGRLLSNPGDEDIPIMAHPPANTSDLSLEQFLRNVSATQTKGAKLDFKTTEVFLKSTNIVTQFSKMFSSQNNSFLWLNADIIPGPVNSTVIPVDADTFLGISHKLFPNLTLSVGWTTRFGGDVTEGNYTKNQAEAMLNALTRNNVTGNQVVTFPVRACFAVRSPKVMQYLLETFESTLTVWGGKDDPKEPAAVRALVDEFGRDFVYVDLPYDINRAGRSATILPVVTVVFAIAMVLVSLG